MAKLGENMNPIGTSWERQPAVSCDWNFEQEILLSEPERRRTGVNTRAGSGRRPRLLQVGVPGGQRLVSVPQARELREVLS